MGVGGGLVGVGVRVGVGWGVGIGVGEGVGVVEAGIVVNVGIVVADGAGGEGEGEMGEFGPPLEARVRVVQSPPSGERPQEISTPGSWL